MHSRAMNAGLNKTPSNSACAAVIVGARQYCTNRVSFALAIDPSIAITMIEIAYTFAIV